MKVSCLCGEVVAAPLHDGRPSPINDRYSESSHFLNQPAWAVHLARDQGRQSCAMLDRGRSLTEALVSLANAGPYNREETFAITAAAIAVYCPWHNPT